MRTMGRNTRVLFLILAMVIVSSYGVAWGFELKWGTAPAGGLWPVIGTAMLETVTSKNPGITGNILPGPGGHNFLGIQSGNYNIAFATTDASYFAWEGKEIYQGKPMRNFRHVGTFFPHPFQWVVWADSGIKTIPDLKGKRITYGARGSGSELNVRKVLELYGLLDKVRFEYLSFTDAGNQMKDKLLDGLLAHFPLPHATVMELANSRPIRLLQIPEDKIQAMLAWNQGLEKFAVPPGAYKGITEPVPGYAYHMHLIVSQDVPDDIVYRITKAIAENLSDYENVSKAMAGIKVKDMGRKNKIPFHPGALKYYQEIKVQ